MNMGSSKLLGALEAGGTKMVCAVGHSDGEIVASCMIDTMRPEETVGACARWFSEWDIEALGIGAFGPTAVDPVSSEYGFILDTPKRGWSHFNLLGTMAETLNVPMGYDTDVNVACLGEATFGCARGLKNVVYLTVGTGVGAGVMVDGSLLHGTLHPEAGHILLTRDSMDPMPADVSGCPYHENCLEGLIAGPAIARRWNGKIASDVADDETAMGLLSRYLGRALATLTLCYAPERIIVGGGVADHTPLVAYARREFKKALNGYFDVPATRDVESYVRGNSLSGKQGILGCLELARRALG